MRLGFSMLFFGPRVLASHHGVLRELKAAGYDGVEVPTVEAEVAELRELGKMLDGEGLARSAVGFCGPEVDPASPHAAVRQAAADHLRRLIDRASALGCDVLGGPMHSAYATFPARSDASVGANPQLLARSAEVLRGVAAHAQAAGVVLGLEYLNRFECCLVTTAAQTLSLIHISTGWRRCVRVDLAIRASGARAAREARSRGRRVLRIPSGRSAQDLIAVPPAPA